MSTGPIEVRRIDALRRSIALVATVAAGALMVGSVVVGLPDRLQLDLGWLDYLFAGPF